MGDAIMSTPLSNIITGNISQETSEAMVAQLLELLHKREKVAWYLLLTHVQYYLGNLHTILQIYCTNNFS